MKGNFRKILQGHQACRAQYAAGQASAMRFLAQQGQQPAIMMVACCDSRVDPAVILQCDPGELFVVRNVANIVPPYQPDGGYHGTSAALEFGIRFLNVAHLILLGHSQCGGIQALLNEKTMPQNDFIGPWVSILDIEAHRERDVDACAKASLAQSYQNCLGFPWIQERAHRQELKIHRWIFDIKLGQIFAYQEDLGIYEPLNAEL